MMTLRVWDRQRRQLSLLALLVFSGTVEGHASQPTSLGEASQAPVASRPRAALEAEGRLAEEDLRDLTSRLSTLSRQAEERKAQLGRRVRALYKLSAGGWLELLSRSNSVSELGTKQTALGRLVRRDLTELAALSEELQSIERVQAHRDEAAARARTLSTALAGPVAAQSPAATPVLPSEGPLQRLHALRRPVRGEVSAPFGPYREGARGETPVELTRRGVELRTHAGRLVLAAAAGVVRWVGELPGHGLGVILDHGSGVSTVTGGLRSLRVEPGATVTPGTRLGLCAGSAVYFELTSAGTAIDPTPWLEALAAESSPPESSGGLSSPKAGDQNSNETGDQSSVEEKGITATQAAPESPPR